MAKRGSAFSAVLGLGVYGGSLVGLLGLVGALAASVRGDFVASGVFLAASALAFGSVSKAMTGG